MLPRIFISYIKEDEEYREQIQKLIRTLKMQGLTVITTDDIKFGTRFSMYKEQIEECNFVLCICTPKYKEKADTNRHGSDVVISSDIYKVNESKFIPVLLKEDEENSFPIWAKNKKYIDYRNGSDKELIYFARAVNKYVEAYESRKSYEESESIIIEHSDGTCERKNVVCAFKAIDTGDRFATLRWYIWEQLPFVTRAEIDSEMWNREKKRRLQEYPKLDYEYEKSVVLSKN